MECYVEIAIYRCGRAGNCNAPKEMESNEESTVGADHILLADRLVLLLSQAESDYEYRIPYIYISRMSHICEC